MGHIISFANVLSYHDLSFSTLKIQLGSYFNLRVSNRPVLEKPRIGARRDVFYRKVKVEVGLPCLILSNKNYIKGL